MLLCALLLLVATQSLSLAHEFAHSEHEQTELCEVLNSFGSNKALIQPECSQGFSSHTQIGFADLPISKVETQGIFNHRARAPPRFSLS